VGIPSQAGDIRHAAYFIAAKVRLDGLAMRSNIQRTMVYLSIAMLLAAAAWMAVLLPVVAVEDEHDSRVGIALIPVSPLLAFLAAGILRLVMTLLLNGGNAGILGILLSMIAVTAGVLSIGYTVVLWHPFILIGGPLLMAPATLFLIFLAIRSWVMGGG